MARNGYFLACNGVDIDAVFAPFAEQLTFICFDVLQEIAPLHAGNNFRRMNFLPVICLAASSRRISSIMVRASWRFSFNSSRLRACDIASGTSSIRPKYHPSSVLLISAVKAKFLFIIRFLQRYIMQVK